MPWEEEVPQVDFPAANQSDGMTQQATTDERSEEGGADMELVLIRKCSNSVKKEYKVEGFSAFCQMIPKDTHWLTIDYVERNPCWNVPKELIGRKS